MQLEPSNLEDVLDVVGELIGESDRAAVQRETDIVRRLELMVEREAVEAIRADLTALQAYNAGAAKTVADELAALEDRLEIRAREINLAVEERLLELQAPIAELAAIRLELRAAADAAAETRGLLDDAMFRVRETLDVVVKEHADRLELRVREAAVELSERFAVLASRVKDGAPGERGERGLPGLGVTHRGTWTEGETYATNDEVVFKGSMFRAITDNPGPIPGDGWRSAAQRGKAGPPGDRGEPGPRGAPGAPAPKMVGGTFEDAGLMLELEDGSILTIPFSPKMISVLQAFEVHS